MAALAVAALSVLVPPLADAGTPADRSFDGTGNNRSHPEWGAAGIELLRLIPPAYADGRAAPSGSDRPGARAISNACSEQPEAARNRHGATDFLWAWGQFLDHDLSLTEAATPAEHFDVPVPMADPHFDPAGTGEEVIPLLRSRYAPGRVRQQVNQITAWIDASQVYGSSEERARALRRPGKGADMLRTSAGRLLPFNRSGLDNAPTAADPRYFLAGDVRANENVALTALHTLFAREHNRIVRMLRRQGQLDSEERYQLARALVAGQIQAITYREFLPTLLGPGALAPYEGYRSSVNPGISNVFSTVSFRFGHSLLPSRLLRLDRDGTAIDAGHLRLRDAFFAPRELIDHGVEPLLRGLASRRAQEIDAQVVDGVRNLLFGRPGEGGFDLAALNIQRGRDHGIPDYNRVRTELGLARAASFSEIASDPTAALRLAEIYPTVDQIDPWLGALAADHQPGAMVSELNFHLLRDQFERLRDGDRFWYERSLSPEWVRWVEKHSLARIIRRNTRIGRGQIPKNPFVLP